MENRGLCVTCVHDKTCSFPRKFPVIQCEEFETITQKIGMEKEKVTNKK